LCKVCNLESDTIKARIEELIRGNIPYREISKIIKEEYSISVSYGSIYLHAQHLPTESKPITPKEEEQTLVVTRKILSPYEEDKLEAYSLIYGRKKAKQVLGY